MFRSQVRCIVLDGTKSAEQGVQCDNNDSNNNNDSNYSNYSSDSSDSIKSNESNGSNDSNEFLEKVTFLKQSTVNNELSTRNKYY